MKNNQDKPISPEQQRALARYAKENGVRWKRQLMIDWSRASAPAVLHALRNTHGPLWLTHFDPEAK